VATEQALLVLADIVGYTKFMKLHRLNLAHSQDITARLLEAMVDAVPSLRLVEIEGDAVFLYVPHGVANESSSASLAFALAMHQAFHGRQQWMVARNMCSCDACRQIGQLRVKFVAHVGEVATQTIKKRTKLVGVDVIAAHRMLKNTVPVPEYILMSESMYERCEPGLRARSVPIDQELEGLGTTTSYFVDLEGIALEPVPVPKPTFSARVSETAGVMGRCCLRVVGIRKLRAPDRAGETTG
jgi:class 3 adenylate cyclase